jgi:anti-sigma factor RsiW
MSLALDGLLDDNEQQWLDDHVAGCAACRAEWQAMRQVSTLFENSTMAGPPLGFAIRVERRLEEKRRKRKRKFGGVAVLTGSLSLAGVTLAAVVLVILGVVVWPSVASMPSVQQGSGIVSQVASGFGLVSKGANLFLKDLLLRYGLVLVAGTGAVVVVLAGFWTWIFVKRPGSPQGHNRYA